MVSGTILVGGTYGTLAVIIARLTTDITENHAWVFVGAPIALCATVFIWPRIAGIFGFED